MGDTIRVVKYETRYQTVYDTVIVEIQPIESSHKVFIDTLVSYLGTKEDKGNNRSVDIDRFMGETCGLIGQAWCGGYLSYGLKVNGHQTPELPCWSPSFFDKNVTWNRGDQRKLKKGEIFGLYFRSKGRVAHVGAVVEDFGDGWVLTIEGNTDDAGGRDGNGVYKRLRHKSQLYIVSDWII